MRDCEATRLELMAETSTSIKRGLSIREPCVVKVFLPYPEIDCSTLPFTFHVYTRFEAGILTPFVPTKLGIAIKVTTDSLVKSFFPLKNGCAYVCAS